VGGGEGENEGGEKEVKRGRGGRSKKRKIGSRWGGQGEKKGKQ